MTSAVDTTAAAGVGEPRCAFPRASLMVSARATAVSSAVASLDTKEMQVGGPRCAYPRGSVVIEEVAAPGPRCAWPKVSATNVEEAHVLQEDQGVVSIGLKHQGDGDTPPTLLPSDPSESTSFLPHMWLATKSTICHVSSVLLP